jgi:hypothetical protein
MSFKGDFKKVKKQALAAGWRVVETKETWLFYPPRPAKFDRLDERYGPCKIGHTPSSQRTWRNFTNCLKTKGLDLKGIR